MINGVNPNAYSVGQIYQNKPDHQSIDSAVTNSSGKIDNIDSRASEIAFIQSSTADELSAKIDSLIGRSPSLAAINLNEIMSSTNGDEVVGRIKRLSGSINLESARVLEKEQALISQGRAEGKSDKDILISIVEMKDRQSDLYKMSTLWGVKGLSSPANYDKLVELTPDYVDFYA